MRKWISKYTGMWRGLRITYWLYNILHFSKLKTNRQFYKKSGIKKKVWQSISHADITHQAVNIPWLDEASITEEKIKQHPLFAAFSATVQQQLLQWPKNGLMIIPGLMRDEADLINNEIENLLQRHIIDFNFTKRKIMNAWEHSTFLKKVFHHPVVFSIMQFIFDREVVPFQTINFIYGSEQKPHSDAIHMTTEPLGYLAAIWIALEDINEGSGELIYYPGSHKLNYIMSEDYNTGNNSIQLGENNYLNYEKKIETIIANNLLVARKFQPKKGDILIWHANLLHGGSMIVKPEKTRKSMVAHYFAEGVLCYHEISQRPAILNK